ncbi:MAG: hypothetical protein NTU53_07040 [Planctomycetota bacterium]|nr:hypothetical protein [Planctomycetota bacterium]
MAMRKTVMNGMVVFGVLVVLGIWVWQGGGKEGAGPGPGGQERKAGGVASTGPVEQASRPSRQAKARGVEGGVDPTYELEGMISQFEKEAMRSSEEEVRMAEYVGGLGQLRREGKSVWAKTEWLKEAKHYRGLDTKKLGEEVFRADPPIFGLEMSIFEDRRFGFLRLEIMHDGFAELMKREDLWEGMLGAYASLTERIRPESDLQTIVSASLNLDAMRHLYGQATFKKQVKGREKVFLKANLETLKQYRKYIDTFDAKKVGSETPFFTEPVMVAEVALMLAKQIDGRGYEEVAAKVKGIRWPAKQDLRDVRGFLDVVIRGLGDMAER